MNARKQKALRDRPVYFVVRTMADPSTGEIAGCLVPASWTDRQILRERRLRTNDTVRAALHNPRNAKFHRLVHQLGALTRENVEGFEGLDSHGVIKRLQAESGVFCESAAVPAAPVVDSVVEGVREIHGDDIARAIGAVLAGIRTLNLTRPSSIAFDCMDESDFRQFWEGICRHLINRYWPALTTEQITEMAELMPQSEGG